MPQYTLSPAAARDIEQILSWSHEQFGERARIHYETLLIQAIQDITLDPERAGSHVRPEIAPAARTYHLKHSLRRVAGRRERVSHPRHFLLYRVHVDGHVEVGRVLHDSVDLHRHMTKDARLDEANE